jgi:hypothetical protein
MRKDMAEPVSTYYTRICLERMRKTSKRLGKNLQTKIRTRGLPRMKQEG